MPVFSLEPDTYDFPSPHYAEPDGLLAVGGDLAPQRLINAYKNGIFPWYSDEYPILWWSPHPRFVLFPEDFHEPRSLRRCIRRGIFSTTIDTAFEDVIVNCSIDRGQGTWLVDEMINAYIKLHELGIAHSVETWKDGELVGGLYGVSLGRAFFGESMFYKVSDASKVALVCLVELIQKLDFDFIDCQQETEHLARFGARAVDRIEFIDRLDESLEYETLQGCWKDYIKYILDSFGG